MKVGILDIDSQMKRDNRGEKRKYPNIACGKIYGFHKSRGDVVVYPWKDTPVDRLYISTIFTNSRATIEKNLWVYELFADEVIIGGTGWDDYSVKPWKISRLPPEIEAFDEPHWTYEMYDLDYGIGFSTRGCHVGCSFCVVPKKEGLVEYRDSTVEKLLNPRSKHLVLMNNNSFAHHDFMEDIEQIKHYNLSIHWDQANDITLVTPEIADALRSVNYRSFDGRKKELFFAFDLMVKRKRDKTGEMVSYDMLKVVPEKVRMLKESGIRPSHLKFYMLIGFNTTEEEDLARVECLKSLGCEIYPMLYRDLTGKIGVDATGKPQSFHVRPMRDWIHTGLYRKQSLHDFDRYWQRWEEVALK
ncbi:hypothetical protein [Paenibacillus sp. HJGM_3]|uniref:hypothetical protein n=1 Tax=Paenibacillus sp. HJGM_3 TaxID=3379816 RepID=UPI00385DE38F